MKRPALDALRARIARRMQAGAIMTWRDVWAFAPDASRAWAHDTLRNWRKSGLIHVIEWRRGQQGPATPAYRWGAGDDAPRPAPYSVAQKCERWRARNPDAVARARRRYCYKRRKTPILDPLHAALLGYRRHGGGWVKRTPPATGELKGVEIAV